jgi:hypothetical protein
MQARGACIICVQSVNNLVNIFQVATSDPLNPSWLPSETFEMKSRILTLSVTKLRYNSGNSLKTSELFIGGDIHCVTYHFLRNVLKITTPRLFSRLQFSFYSLNERVLTVLLDLQQCYKKQNLLGLNHVAVRGFCNIILTLIHLCAFVGSN